MPWIQVHLTSDKPSAPMLESLLETLGAISVTLTDAGDEPQLHRHRQQRQRQSLQLPLGDQAGSDR